MRDDLVEKLHSEISRCTSSLLAEDIIADVDVSCLWPVKVLTEMTPAGPFWEAEPEHQDDLEKYLDGCTCHFIRPNWTLPHREKAAPGANGVSAA